MKKRNGRRIASLALAASILAGMLPTPNSEVQAQYVAGNAPFINSWLVSGPYETPVVDEIYGTVIPENPNLAKNAKTSASSATFETNPPEFLVDGSTRNQWVTEGKEVPCWVQLEWDTPIELGCMTIAQWGDGRHVNQWYDLTFTFEDGTQSDTIRVNSTSSSSAEPTQFVPQGEFGKVKSVKVEIDKGLDPYPSITGISEIEVYQYAFDTESLAVARTAAMQEEENISLYATASASSIWQSNAYDYPDVTDKPASNAHPKFAIDGNLSTEWISQMHNTLDDPSTWPKWDPEPTLTLNWDTDATISHFVLYERHNDAWPADTSNVDQVDYTFKDRSGKVLTTGTVDSFVADSPDGVEVVLPEPVKEVASAELKIVYEDVKNDHNVGLGFREVEMYGVLEEEVLPEPEVKITPELGGTIVDGGLKWEYFDDRIWNRTYDDYQDLYGYYGVKKGVDTKNKYVYAHTYVYSPKQQRVQFRFGSSGEHRLYVNDIAVTKPSKPSEVQKDMVKKDITLKQGWNKIMLQIKHTYTDDKNANGVPIAQDNDVYYLGFYGRITDASGNEVEGLQYSVTGTDTDLTITTGGLAAEDAVDDGKMGRGLPENELPIGYTEWPYVWNESQYKNAQHNLSASAFQFMANGGEPGYQWSLAEGSSLPAGLTLNEDGTIGGFVECDPGEYPFTVQVTDASGATAQKEFSITVKERPNKWFEEGRVGALSHTGPIYQYFVDPNFSADLWAERASRQGHSLVSVETNQQNYYWPSRFSDSKNERQEYLPKDENGQVVDGLKQFEEAVKRYDMRFGLYYASQITDKAVQELEDLILRYDPSYLYFDGPQFFSGSNFDVTYSAIRNYSDDIIVNANAWGTEYGDPDLRTGECGGIYARQRGSNLTKRTIMEPWKSVHTKNNYTPYYARRDDYRLVAQEMIMNAGRGMVDNNDQMPIMSRGTNWDSPEDVATRYPKSLQEFIDVREGLAAWFAPEGKPERHESTTGTMPYFLNGSTCGCSDDGKGNIDHFEEGHGPKWGYSMYRDNNIYLHIMKGPDGRTGFDAIADRTLTVDPISDNVEKVIWLNEDKEIPFTQNGGSITIDLTDVEEDQVDTIIKVVTDNPERKYKLTDVVAEGEQVAADSLKVKVEGYMTYQALKANLEEVTFTSADPTVAAVDENGMVSPVSDGTTEIRVTGTYEGVTKEDVLKVVSRDGMVYVGEEMIGASLWVDDRESYGEFTHLTEIPYHLEGRSEKGGAIGLDGAKVTMKSGIVDLDGGDKYTPVKIDESDMITFADGKLVSKQVSETTRMAVWAEVELDGQKFTTNRVYLDIYPYNNLSLGASITSDDSLTGYEAQNVADEKLIEGTEFDASKWSAAGDKASALTFDLNSLCTVSNIEVNFNSKSQNYYNTPKTMEIQISENGTDWNTVKTVTPPTPGQGAYFGFSDIYAIDPVNTQYVRLYFPDGSNGSTLDILEVAVNGTDLSNRLDSIDVEAVSTSDTTAKLDVTGYNGMGEEISMDEAEVEITSMNPEIIAVNESGELEAVAQGRAQIKVQAALNGAIAETMLYADVDADGKLFFGEYLKEITLNLNKNQIAMNEPIQAEVTGTLNTEKQADISRASVEYVFGDERLSVVDGSNIIVLNEEVQNGFTTTVQVRVTLDGVTVVSEPKNITVTGKNLSANAKITVSSSFGDDGMYLGTNVIDGNKATHWASTFDDSGKAPWIQLDFGKDVTIGEINLIDRGHSINEIGEGLLEWEGGSMVLTGIKWDGQPDNVFTFETPIKTSWLKFTIDPENKYFQSGSARGLAEFEVYAADEETAPEILGYKQIAVDTTAGEMPELPTQVEAIYNDGSVQVKNVVWDDIPEDQLKTEGFFIVEGTVEGTDVKATATVRVSGNLDETVDKTLLQNTYEYALTLSTEGVTDSAKAYFEKVLSEAKAVLDDPNATQEEVNTAWDNLLEGIWGLGITQGDKTMLEQLIAKAESMIPNQDKYVQDHWQELVDALEAAKKVMDDGDAMKEDVEAAADALLNAIQAQRYKANKSNLEDLINKANAMDLSQYTAESVAVFKAALANANLVLADESLSVDDQSVVDNAVKELEAAIDNLSTAEETPSNPDNPDDGEETPSNPDKGEEGTQTPTTGDYSDTAILFTAVFAMMMLAALAIIWRKKQNEM